jgi:hypothetical protein
MLEGGKPKAASRPVVVTGKPVGDVVFEGALVIL